MCKEQSHRCITLSFVVVDCYFGQERESFSSKNIFNAFFDKDRPQIMPHQGVEDQYIVSWRKLGNFFSYNFSFNFKNNN